MNNIEPTKEKGRSPVIEIPMRGKKRKRIAPLIEASDTISSEMMQENIISLLAFGKRKSVRAICNSGLKPNQFEGEVYRRLAEESFKYFEKYGYVMEILIFFRNQC